MRPPDATHLHPRGHLPERCDPVFAARDAQNVLLCKCVRQRMSARSSRCCCGGQVVVRSAQLHDVTDDRPVCARSILVRPADASWIHEAPSVDEAVLLHVRVARDDELLFHTVKDPCQLVICGCRRDDLNVRARRRVTEEDEAEHRVRGQSR